MDGDAKELQITTQNMKTAFNDVGRNMIPWNLLTNSTLQLRHCLGFGPCWRLHKAGVFETQAHMEPKISTNRDDMLSTRWMNIGNSIYYMCILCPRTKRNNAWKYSLRRPST